MQQRRRAFTLVEMLVVILIILVLAALAAAFLPRVNESNRLTRAVDSFEQWLITAKMRAKRDKLATGVRFIPDPASPGVYSQFQYVQQPDPLSGGFTNSNGAQGGAIVSAAGGMVTFGNVDFSLGGLPPLDSFGRQQWLVQTGDYLEINGGGVVSIWGVVVPPPGQPANTIILGGILAPAAIAPSPTFTQQWTPALPTTVVSGNTLVSFAAGGLTFAPTFGMMLWQSPYEQSIASGPTTNFRILRQPRILLGEEPLVMSNNYAANFNPIPGYIPATPGCNVLPAPSGYPEIVFAPSGAVVGTNAGNPYIVVSVWDSTMDPNAYNPDLVSIVGIKGQTGFIGTFGVSPPGNYSYFDQTTKTVQTVTVNDPFWFVRTSRDSGM